MPVLTQVLSTLKVLKWFLKDVKVAVQLVSRHLVNKFVWKSVPQTPSALDKEHKIFVSFTAFHITAREQLWFYVNKDNDFGHAFPQFQRGLNWHPRQWSTLGDISVEFSCVMRSWLRSLWLILRILCIRQIRYYTGSIWKHLSHQWCV